MAMAQYITEWSSQNILIQTWQRILLLGSMFKILFDSPIYHPTYRLSVVDRQDYILSLLFIIWADLPYEKRLIGSFPYGYKPPKGPPLQWTAAHRTSSPFGRPCLVVLSYFICH